MIKVSAERSASRRMALVKAAGLLDYFGNVYNVTSGALRGAPSVWAARYRTGGFPGMFSDKYMGDYITAMKVKHPLLVPENFYLKDIGVSPEKQGVPHNVTPITSVNVAKK